LPIKFNYDQAKATLAIALDLSHDTDSLPVEWRSHARAVFKLASKTYTPALATLLLAKAVNDAVDTLSIKVTGDRSYSLRGLGHEVIVPAAVTHGFSLRTTGREPLNNQPWFRYDRIDQFERVKGRKDYLYFLEVARRANELTAGEALMALAAFLSVATEEAHNRKAVAIKVTGLTPYAARIAAEDFLRHDAPDRPKRLQAFAAACLDLVHQDVRSRRIHDPSRDYRGDVHAFVGDVPVLAMEVRGKAVPVTELAAFADACASAGIGRAILFVDSALHRRIDLDSLESYATSSDAVQVTVFESTASLVQAALTWADLPLYEATARLARATLDRLREIEVPTDTLTEWERVIAVVQAR
jgi:hypothetical protein